MTCRVALSCLQAAGLITLAPSQIPNARPRPHFAAIAATDAQTPIKQPVYELAILTLCPVSGAAQSRRWNTYVSRDHYLRYTPMSGSQLRYDVFAGEQLVALISFGASSWKLKQRELFIGWQGPERLRNLQLIVNNARFLILTRTRAGLQDSRQHRPPAAARLASSLWLPPSAAGDLRGV